MPYEKLCKAALWGEQSLPAKLAYLLGALARVPPHSTEGPRLCGGQESKRNQLKDFVNIAGPLGVTHFLILTATETAAYLRVAKTPQVRRCA